MESVSESAKKPILSISSEFSSEFFLGLGIGIASSALAYFFTQLFFKSKANDEWSNKQVKKSVLELVGKTPMLKLQTLSKVLGNEIFVGSV